MFNGICFFFSVLNIKIKAHLRNQNYITMNNHGRGIGNGLKSEQCNINKSILLLRLR